MPLYFEALKTQLKDQGFANDDWGGRDAVLDRQLSHLALPDRLPVMGQRLDRYGIGALATRY